ncbi:MAG: hypothetical protein NTX61_09690 [Bacteroidetes bacterium]|nr:hypothetical protein [Bacteroidota bacterium]
MKLEITLNTENAADEINELNDFIREQNIKGIITKVAQREPQPGEMSIGDYMPIIQMILGSTVVAAGVKGLFDILKNYFDLQKQRVASKADVEKANTEQQKIAFTVEKKDGSKINLQFSSFSDSERKNFFKTVDKVFNE